MQHCSIPWLKFHLFLVLLAFPRPSWFWMHLAWKDIHKAERCAARFENHWLMYGFALVSWNLRICGQKCLQESCSGVKITWAGAPEFNLGLAKILDLWLQVLLLFTIWFCWPLRLKIKAPLHWVWVSCDSKKPNVFQKYFEPRKSNWAGWKDNGKILDGTHKRYRLLQTARAWKLQSGRFVLHLQE